MDQQTSRWIRAFGFFFVIVGEIVASTGVGLLIGWLLKTELKAPEWTLLVTGLLGFGFSIFRIARWAEREQERPSNNGD